MSFSEKQLKQHCDKIIRQSAIRNSILVLCEGDFKDSEQEHEILTIKDRAEKIQDAAFYKNAVPDWWHKDITKALPVFYPCGSRQNVIDGYFYLKKLHEKEQPDYSHLNHHKFFALVDIDLQKATLDSSYSFKNLEDIYLNLYLNGNVNQDTVKNHKIWVTGLIHKEAYYFIPQLQDLFDKHSLDLKLFYQKILASLSDKSKEENQFFISKSKKRITHHQGFKHVESVEEFQAAWQEIFNHHETSEAEKEQLIYALLTVAKSKSTWQDIKPNETAKNPKIKAYQDNLSLKIARDFYAKQPRHDNQHHLPSFFNALLTHYF